MFDFDDDALDQLEATTAEAQQEPVLVCFYSGGFSHPDGFRLMSPVVSAAAQVGLGDALVMGFPDHYGIVEEGYEPYSKYVDMLVEELDNDEACSGRPLLLFGMSRGACSAMALATRLGKRVLKVYIASCPAIKLGEPTGWEMMSGNFKKGGRKMMLQWLSSLQPQDMLLKRTSDQSEEEILAAMAQSKWLDSMVKLMWVQYRDACFPRMTGDHPTIQAVPAPIVVFIPLRDDSTTLENCKPWAEATTGSCEFVKVDQGHMDVVDKGGAMLAAFQKDVAQFVQTASGKG